jgi:hypothetical protein
VLPAKKPYFPRENRGPGEKSQPGASGGSPALLMIQERR